MKKFYLPLIAILLFSCEVGTTSQPDRYATELSDDLKTLLISSPSNEKSELPFNYEASITPSPSNEGYYVTSVLFTYKDVEIEDVHFVMVPFSYDLSRNITAVANVGYSEHNFVLTETPVLEEYKFKGLRISFLVDNDEDGIKVLFKSKDHNTMLFSFSNDEINKLTI